MIHVLVVDDEPQLLRTLTMNLSGRGYRVSTAPTGTEALQLATSDPPDLMLLDLGLPDLDGTDVIRTLRHRGQHLPIIVLSARVGSHDKVTALEFGASDYITKPFDMSELIARIHATTRRVEISEPAPTVQLGPVTVDLAHQHITHDDPLGHDIRLTPTEWRMLETLLRRPDTIVTGTQLLLAMRGDAEHVERSYLRSYMQQLRHKLEADPHRPRYLITEHGLGYRYQP